MSETGPVAIYKANSSALLRNPDDPQALIEQFAHLHNTTAKHQAERYLFLAKRAWRLAPTNYEVAFHYAIAMIAVGENAEGIKVAEWCVANAPDKDWLGKA